ncbi:sensor histidine kinase [hydrothermal vent metagenome]|uniref:histidine kinase n=1 Tax=hydrothermal vent metagenome TaxID=652676 RepID=A0A3B0ZE38_9ZZZZ
MRLLPQSLFGRLALILLSGLLLAQLLSTLLQFHDRGQRLFQASGAQSAERIAEIVRLLDSENSEGRQQLVAILNVPPLKVSLSIPIWLNSQAIVAGSPSAEFRDRLETFLGKRYPLKVVVSDQPAMNIQHKGSGSMMHMQHMGMTGPDALVFLAQVQLSDGRWVTFENRIGNEFFANSTMLLVNLAVLIIIVLLVTLIAVRLATRPLTLLAKQADKLGTDINQPPMVETGSTEMRHASHAFNTMQRRLQRFIEDRSRLLSAISHDLKTPITRMRLRAEMLDEAEQRDNFIRNLDEMQAITSDTLDFLRADDAGENIEDVDICTLLKTIKDQADELGQNVEIKFCEVDSYLARPQALKRCIVNLVDNAIKYAGSAEITASESNNTLLISVCDSGLGIPEQQLEAVFKPFYRLETSRSRETGGTGLGLSIARNIALSHGGDLQLANRKDGGLKATLTLLRQSA